MHVLGVSTVCSNLPLKSSSVSLRQGFFPPLLPSNWSSLSVRWEGMQNEPVFQVFGRICMSVCACVYTHGITLVYILRARPLLPTLFLFSASCILPELGKVHSWWLCHDLDPQTHLCCQNMVATSRWWTATSLSGVQCDDSCDSWSSFHIENMELWIKADAITWLQY